MLDLGENIWSPLPKAILDESEFGELTLVFLIIAK
jgi:hypothetical protein